MTEEVPLLILNAKAVTAPRKPSIREGRSFMVVSGCVCVGVYVGRKEKCSIYATRTTEKPMPTARTNNNMAHPQSNRVVRWKLDGFVGFLVGGAHTMSSFT